MRTSYLIQRWLLLLGFQKAAFLKLLKLDFRDYSTLPLNPTLSFLFNYLFESTPNQSAIDFIKNHFNLEFRQRLGSIKLIRERHHFSTINQIVDHLEKIDAEQQRFLNDYLKTYNPKHLLEISKDEQTQTTAGWNTLLKFEEIETYSRAFSPTMVNNCGIVNVGKLCTTINLNRTQLLNHPIETLGRVSKIHL